MSDGDAPDKNNNVQQTQVENSKKD